VEVTWNNGRGGSDAAADAEDAGWLGTVTDNCVTHRQTSPRRLIGMRGCMRMRKARNEKQ